MTRILVLLLSITVAIFLTALVIYIFDGYHKLWTRLAGLPKVEKVDFKTLKKTSTPNQFLLCPPDYCPATPDQIAPIFDISAVELKAKFQAIILQDLNVSQILFEDTNLAEGYISKTDFFKFPNLVNVEYFELENGQSTLAIYARAKFGDYDFGANRKLVERWMAQLN